MQPGNKLMTVGWREWVSLPELGIGKIKVKLDTGARTSTLHAFDIERFRKQGKDCVKFSVHPLQNNMKKLVNCVADIVDIRAVTTSSGHREQRIFIQTALQLAEQSWPIELTLISRDILRFRMLLGRTAMKQRLLIDPTASYLTKKIRFKS